MEMFSGILAGTITSAAPLLLAAMGGIIAQQANVLNIAMEGMMLAGAFGAVTIGHFTGSLSLALVAAMFGGALFASPFLLTIYLQANIVVVGFGIIALASALFGYILPVFLGVWGAYMPINLPLLPKIVIPWIGTIPVLGPIFNDKTPLVYFSWISVFLTSYILYRTTWGIHVRATGKDPESARAAGIPVNRVQFQALLLSGIMSGLAGAQLAVGELGFFHKEMIGGRGFIALAAFYFGGFKPIMSGIACILFGLFEAIEYRLQGMGVPPQLIHMIPYIAVCLVLILIQVQKRARKRTPASLLH